MANAEAFTNLLRVLHDVKGKPDLGFTMETWTTRPVNVEPARCGYSACAVGWAAQDEWFQKQGLGFIEWYAGQLQLVRYNTNTTDGYDTGWDAVMIMFDIEPNEATHLFDIAAYRSYDDDDAADKGPITIDEVIGRVEQFVSDGYSVPEND